MSQAIRRVVLVVGLAGIAVAAACSGSDGGGSMSASAVETAEDQPREDTDIKPMGLIIADSDPGEFAIAFNKHEATSILDHIWTSGQSGNADTAALLEAAEAVDYAHSMLVAATAAGCAYDGMWLTPLTNALVQHAVFSDDEMDCAQDVYFTEVFAVPLTGPAGDGGNYRYGQSALPTVIPSRVDASPYSLADRSNGTPAELFPLPAGAIEADAWTDLETANLAYEATEFVFDEDELFDLFENVDGSDWVAVHRRLSTLDLGPDYAVLLVVESCLPDRMWAEYHEPELVFVVGENLATCDIKDPYAALFVLPRSWQPDEDEPPAYSIERLLPD